MGKLLRNLFLFLFLLLTCLIIAAILIAWKFDRQAEQYFISLINKQLKSELKVSGDIGLSLLSEFPNAAFSLEQVKVQGSLASSTAPLIQVDKLAFVFGIPDLFRGTYHIKQLVLEDGQINLETNRMGEANYEIFKEANRQSNSAADLQLGNAELRSIDVNLHNHLLEQKISYFISSGRVQASQSGVQQQLKLRTEGILNYCILDEVDYINTKSLSLDASISSNTEAERYEIKQAKISLLDNHFLAGGTVSSAEAKSIIDLKINGVDLKLASLLSLLPKGDWAALDFTDQQGDLLFDASIKGIYSSLQHPAVQANVSLSDATLRHKYLGYPMKDFSLIAKFSNGYGHNLEASNVELSDLSFDLLGEQISVKGDLIDLNAPKANFKINGAFDLYALARYARSKGFNELVGKLQFEDIHLQSRGAGDQTQLGLSGKLSSSFSTRYKDQLLEMNGSSLEFMGNDWLLRNNHLNLPGGSILLDADLRQMTDCLTAFALADSTATIEEIPKAFASIELQSEQLDLEPLLRMMETEQAQKTSTEESPDSLSTQFGLQDLIETRLSAQIGKLKHENLIIEDFSGQIQLKDDLCFMRDLSMKAFGGHAKWDAKIQTKSSGRMVVQNYLRLGQIEAAELLRQMDNFGQNQLTNQHLSGSLDGEFYFEAHFNEKLEFDIDQCYLVGDFSVADGRLRNFAPMQSLSKVAKVKELQDVEFSKMQNQISFKNRILRIPAMQISSNIFSLKFAGNTTQSQNVQYFVQLNLLDLMKKKFLQRNPKAKAEAAGKNGLSLYATMTGDINDPIIKLGQKSRVRARFIKDANTKKQNVGNFVDW